MSLDDPSLWGLFVSAFVSSTLFPGGSEAVLGVLSYRQTHNIWVLLAVATAGNTLGGMSTWAVGRFMDWCLPESLLKKSQYQRGAAWLRRWGSPALLLSWVPILGDPLCLAAGWLRVMWLPALVFIALGKAVRYGVVIFLAG